jgi:CBS domain-containing protein
MAIVSKFRKSMRVRELMSYPVPTVKPDAMVKDVILELFVRKEGIGIITRGGLLKKCEGMVTKSEIYMKVFAANLDPSKVKVSDIIPSRPLVTIGPDASSREAAEMMMKYNVRRLPVVEDDVLVGMITSEDLLKCIK